MSFLPSQSPKLAICFKSKSVIVMPLLWRKLKIMTVLGGFMHNPNHHLDSNIILEEALTPTSSWSSVSRSGNNKMAGKVNALIGKYMSYWSIGFSLPQRILFIIFMSASSMDQMVKLVKLETNTTDVIMEIRRSSLSRNWKIWQLCDMGHHTFEQTVQ